MWLLLMPREVELVMRPTSGQGQNAAVLQEVQLHLNQISGELDLSPDLVERIKGAARNWKGGYEAALKALVSAMERHV